MCRIHATLKSPDDFPTLSGYLAYLRKVRKYTLQDVADMVDESITGKVLPARCSLTPSFLSLLEAGKIEDPSPHKLRALAYVYSVPYEALMQKADYLPDNDQQDGTSPLMPNDVPKLTPNEQLFICEYFDLVRFRRTHHCDCDKRQK